MFEVFVYFKEEVQMEKTLKTKKTRSEKIASNKKLLGLLKKKEENLRNQILNLENRIRNLENSPEPLERKKEENSEKNA